MDLFHLEYGGKSARISLRSLPPAEPEGNLVEKTSTGDVAAFRLINGIDSRLDPMQLKPEMLIEKDPELDLAMAGEILDPEALSSAYYDPAEPERQAVSNFTQVDVVFDAVGQEKERRPHKTRRANISDLYPVKAGKRIPVTQALLQFVFRQCYQLVHEDGLTYDYLHGIARELHEKQEMVILGAGPKGNLPLVMRDRGSAYRGFLYGELGDGAARDQYKLLILLSDQELKRPQPAAPPA